MKSASVATAEVEIRAVIEERAQALRDKDAARLVGCQAPDATFYTLAPPLRDDSDGPGGLAAWFATWDGPIGFEIRDLTVAAGDSAGFGHALTRMTGRKTDGTAVDLWFRTTFGLRKIDGAWRIAHEHESVPFYMDGSGRAALDLKP